MNRRISNAKNKYEGLWARYKELKEQGLDENSIRHELGLTSVQFYALKHWVPTLEVHNWSDGEVVRLCELYKELTTDWDTICNILNNEFSLSLTRIQVKNKFNAIRRKNKHREHLKPEDMPKVKKGRRSKKDAQLPQKQQPQDTEVPSDTDEELMKPIETNVMDNPLTQEEQIPAPLLYYPNENPPPLPNSSTICSNQFPTTFTPLYDSDNIPPSFGIGFRDATPSAPGPFSAYGQPANRFLGSTLEPYFGSTFFDH